MFAPSKSLNRKRVGLDVSHWISQFNDNFEGLDLFNVNADESAAPNFGKTVELTTVAILRQRGISQLYLFGERNFILSSIGKNYYMPVKYCWWKTVEKLLVGLFILKVNEQ